MTSPTALQIIKLSDAQKHPDEIAARLNVSISHVHTVLRRERPDRPRKPRTRTSDLRRMIIGLHQQGFKPPRIAFALKCSKAYVYRILNEIGD